MTISFFDLTGKTALITGGNGGIGLGFARGLAEAGADICIWGTNEQKNAAAVEDLKQFGRKVEAMKVDVGDERAVEGAFAKAVETFGRIDSVFANAGIGTRGTPFVKMTSEEWHDIFRINMDGVFYTFRTAVRHMTERGGGGTLVATSSVASVDGAPRSEHYAATKAGLNAMIRALAVEHARDGIRANAVLPGWIETAMTERSVNNPTFQEKVLKRVPIRRWGQPDDFRGVAVYLASDASAYHTGQVFVIDGGYTVF